MLLDKKKTFIWMEYFLTCTIGGKYTIIFKIIYEQNYPSKFAMQPFAKHPHENQLFGVISKRYYQDELSKDFHVISSEK